MSTTDNNDANDLTTFFFSFLHIPIRVIFKDLLSIAEPLTTLKKKTVLIQDGHHDNNLAYTNISIQVFKD